ncbi:uncharacterized protein LOC132631328 [Lycium barbarum]|uniref:uncharacterized protein LOC132631328 n=1 Tax=Lycium barbarum TaxID=112863 RepID=UPI00293ED4C9|nr:uncharacterized protein LOC132631328 [Lycium barbarum]
MSDSHSVNFQVEPSHHEHDDGDVPNNNTPPVNPVQVGSSVGNEPAGENNRVMLQQLQNQLDVAMAQLQAQQEIIAQLQNRGQAPDIAPSEQTQDTEERHTPRGNENHPGQSTELIRMLEELTKQVESSEKKIEANDKKVENYNSRVDQIPGAPPVLKGPDSKKFIQMSFPPSAAPMKMPKRFRMPDIPKYNGTTDSNEHMTAYTCTIKGNDLADDERESVLLKKFGKTLSKGTMIWYHNLPEHSIDSFAMLADAFVKAHARVIKVETRKSDLFNVKQRDDETLREFVARFRIERMDLLPVTDDWAVQAFSQGLNSRSSITSMELKHNLIEYPAIAWANVHNMYQSKIRVEDDKILRAASVSWHFGKRGHRSRIVIDQNSRSLYDRYRSYPLDRRGNGRNSESGKNDRRNDRGRIAVACHRTEDCRQLREEVARLFNLGHLREFLSERAKTHFKSLDSNKQDGPEEPQQVIHMIMGGTDVPIGPVMKRTKISITREKRIRNDDPDGPITFDDEEMEGIAQPHNDALVISVLVNKFRIKRVLIDPACETTKGEITLPISMAGTTQQTKFYVIEGDMGYNALLGRPWIYLVRAVPSTMHQVLKFPTPEGIKTVRGEQQATKEMFAVEESIKTIIAPDRSKGKNAK